MQAKIIPFRIKSNPEPHFPVLAIAKENPDMDYEYPTPEGNAMLLLCKERRLDVIKDTTKLKGRINTVKLAEELNKRLGANPDQPKIQQSTLHRFINGRLRGKDDTLKPVAKAFGLSLLDFMARVRPESAQTPAPSDALPEEAREIYSNLAKLPKIQREYFREAICNAAEVAESMPNYSKVVSGEVLLATAEVRLARQRRKRQKTG